MKKMAGVLLVLAVMILVSGCGPDWKKRYEALNVEHENLKGLYENSQMNAGQAGQIADELAECRAENSELASQLADCTESIQETGFEGMDQQYDPATGEITVTLPNAILFPSGKASLKSATNAPLDQIVSVLLERYANKEVDVVGHTDTDPIKKSSWKDNWELGSARALSVVRYLQGKGIRAQLLRGVSCGEHRPVGNSKAENRRVEIVVHTR